MTTMFQTSGVTGGVELAPDQGLRDLEWLQCFKVLLKDKIAE